MSAPKAALGALTTLKKLLEEELPYYSFLDAESKEWKKREQHLTLYKSDFIVYAVGEDRGNRTPIARAVFDLAQESEAMPAIRIKIEESHFWEFKEMWKNWDYNHKNEEGEDLSFVEWFEKQFQEKLSPLKAYQTIATHDPLI
jgi:hypothetical protein